MLHTQHGKNNHTGCILIESDYSKKKNKKEWVRL